MKAQDEAPASSSAGHGVAATAARRMAWRRPRWALALALVAAALLVNLLRLSDFRARWNQSLRSSPLPVSPSPKCATLDLTHRDPLFAKDAACLSQPQVVAVLRELVLTAAQLFEAHNITYFLDSGTLLGAFRNASVIAYDTDADLAIDDPGFAYLSSRRVDVREPFFLAVYASGDLYPGSQRDRGIPVRLVHKPTALYADVFVFQSREEEIFSKGPRGGREQLIGPYPSWAFAKCAQCSEFFSQGKLLAVPRSWIYPTAACAFEGAQLQCPRETERYLRYMFGDDFRTPIQY